MEPVNSEEVNNSNPQSRIKVLDNPILAPGTCILCKSAGGDERQFIDLGIQVDWFGAMYFCTWCISEAAKLLGLSDNQEIFKKYEEMLLKYGNEKLEVERLQEQLNASRVLLRNCHCGDSVPSYSDVVDVSVVEETDDSVSDSIADSDESSSVEESGDVSESSDDDDDGEPVKPKRTRRASQSSE